MSLTTTWSPFFQSSARSRGVAFFRAGRVEQTPPDEGQYVRARVKAQETYDVTIQSDDEGQPRLTCTCPTFQRGQYCEHLWAVLVDIQHNGALSEREDEPPADSDDEGNGLHGDGDGDDGSDVVDQADDDDASSTVPTQGIGSSSNQPRATLSPSGRVITSGFDSPPRLPKARKRDPNRRSTSSQQPAWMTQLTLLRPTAVGHAAQPSTPADMLGDDRLVAYRVRPKLSARHNALVVELVQRQAMRRGWGRSRPLKINNSTIASLSDSLDRELCTLLLGSQKLDEDEPDRYWSDDRPHAMFQIPAPAQRTLLQRLIDTGRCLVGSDDLAPTLTWDDDARPWTLWLVGDYLEDVDGPLSLTVQLRRGEQRLAIEAPRLLLGGGAGVVVADGKAAPFDDRGAFRWVQQFRDDMRRHGKATAIRVPRADIPRFLNRLYLMPSLPEIDLPADIRRPEQQLTPTPQIDLYSPKANQSSGDELIAEVGFDYEGRVVMPGQPGRYVVDWNSTESDADQPAASTPSPEQTPGAESDVGANADVNAAIAASERPSELTAVTPAAAEEDRSDEHTETTVLVQRDLEREKQAMVELAQAGFRRSSSGDETVISLPARRLPAAASRLASAGWRIRADRRIIRPPGPASLSVASGLDWFELRGGLRYETENGEQIVPLPALLEAARAGRTLITLDDGGQGILPEQWLQEHGLLTAMGQLEDDHLRFRLSQAAMLDALLAEQDLADVDAAFAQARDRVRHFQQVKPVDASQSFHGALRLYQREGVGWLMFLRWFTMGGILADDMGLGKTIQVLALLDLLHGERAKDAADGDSSKGNGDGEPRDHLVEGMTRATAPSLVVAPRSVVFNWVDEAQRFTPHLRVLTYTGPDRATLRSQFADHDLVITSYGLLRRDISQLREHRFDMAILDEAQAIKNPTSQGAKAARLLNAEHRLALTGTPVENHLGDLWSIFEFLNPGMLGANARFAELLQNGAADPRSIEGARQAARALRPFILRRTKKQVLDELPEKTEQTLHCQMPPEQRKLYDDLRQHYRGTLLKQIDDQPTASIGKSTVLVLEALLRLRQAACHPGLIDPKRADMASAKLEALVEQVEELIEEGHKALVFSQFTSFLALARKQFDDRGVAYEYLDGQTRDRKAPVERFQNDPDCPLFLISLKAGGLGLNLTAAEYVFILDPWWNPAVEQQAIDRAHRIGQTRHVFAYRLICEDTVEQRIAELQQQKRELADAIVGGDQGLVRNLTRKDLEQLLS